MSARPYRTGGQTLRRPRLAGAAASIALFGLLVSQPVLAQDAGGAGTRSFAIAAQPLGQALLDFGDAAGVAIVFDRATVAGRESPGLTGAMTVEAALSRLLAGTGLSYRMNGSQVTLVPAPEPGVEGPLRLDPLMVTGERVERTVFDTASSVAVVPGAVIEETPAFADVEDVFDVIPNILTAGNSLDGGTIRGVDTTGVLTGGFATFGGARPRATITVDGRPLSYNEYIFGETSVWDLERLEVFRGPQTSAQGVNSIAGATYLVTANPTFEPEVKAQGEAGNRNRWRLSAAASGPIVADQLAARIAVDYQRRDSFVDFTGPRPEDGPDPNLFESVVARGKLLWEPQRLPDLSTMLTFSVTQSEGPETQLVMPPFEDLQTTRVVTTRTRAFAGLHDLTYAVSGNLDISNRLSVTASDFERFTLPGFGPATFDTVQITNETTAAWRLPDRGLSGLTGLFYETTEREEISDFSSFGLGLGDFDDTQTNLGIFGETTYQLTGRLDVTAGLRYQRDHQDRQGTLGRFRIDFDETFDALLPKAVIGYDVSDDLRVGVQAVRGFNPGGTTISFRDGSQDTFDEETVWSFEAFGRALLLGDRLAIDANAFYSLHNDLQLFTIVDILPGGLAVVEASNAERAVSYGLELSAEFLATDDLRLFGGLGLLDTEITDFPASVDPEIEGNQFQRAPNVTVSAGADYQLIDDLTLGGQVRYVGRYFSDVDNTGALEAGDYVVADLQLRYAYENFEAYAFVNNAFDTFYRISVRPNRDSAIVGTPRQFGVGVRVRF